MMDAKLIFAEDQAVTTVGDHDSQNILDMGVGLDAFGHERVMDYGENGSTWLTIAVTEDAASAGAATLAFELQTSDAEESGYVASPLSVPAMGKADLTRGTIVLRAPIPAGLKRYLKIVATVGEAALTAGAFTAWLSNGSPTPLRQPRPCGGASPET